MYLVRTQFSSKQSNRVSKPLTRLEECMNNYKIIKRHNGRVVIASNHLFAFYTHYPVFAAQTPTRVCPAGSFQLISLITYESSSCE